MPTRDELQKQLAHQYARKEGLEVIARYAGDLRDEEGLLQRIADAEQKAKDLEQRLAELEQQDQ